MNSPPVRNQRLERIVAVAICTVVMLLPLLYIQHEYDLFTEMHGEAREGAAGAGLALAVVFRTVSRTVLRTIIRTGARAGMRASMKGAFRTAIRSLMRSSSAGIARKLTGDVAATARTVRSSNLRSLLFASALLSASWVIVIGLGQPYTALLTKAEAQTLEAEQAAQDAAELEEIFEQGKASYAAQEEVQRIQDEYRALRVDHKMERDAQKQEEIERQMQQLALELSAAELELKDALEASHGRVITPEDEAQITELPEFPLVSKIHNALFSYAPYPGHQPWYSPVIWLGAILIALPLWLMYAAQAGLAKKMGVTLRHETGIDGGLIQLYFAGAFSFMPLTSDVIVDDATVAQRGRIALWGLLAPVGVSVLLGLCWKATGIKGLLFLADAFLIYPMVQVFPLSPLEGIHLWRHSRLLWVVMFIIIMFLFLVAGSEALRSVI